MKYLPLILIPLLSLAACATPETRLRTGLVKAGLSQAQSACMADRMVNNLSITQLRRISALSSLKQRKLRDMTVSEFLHKIRALKDSEILIVTTKAATLCALER